MKGLLSLLVCILAFVFFPGISGATADFTTLNAEGLRGALLVGRSPAFLSNHCGQGSCATVDGELSTPQFALLAQPKALPFENPDHLAGLLFNHNTLAPSWQKMDEDVSDAGQEWYLLAQIGTGPALAAPQVIRTPSRVLQPQSEHDGEAGHILATLQVRNIQVRAKWEVQNKGNNFTINALAGNSQHGVLRVGNNITLAAGDYVVTVMAIDEFSYLNKAYENLTAMAELTIVAVADGLSFAKDSPFVDVTVGVQREGALYTARVSDGENVNYAQKGDHPSFMVEVSDAGALVNMISILSEAMTVTLTIEASSGEERATLALEVRAYDELSASLAAGFVSQTYVGETGALGTVIGSGGSGDYVYSWALPLPVGFADSGDALSANGEAGEGVYTITAIASDKELSSWVAATVEATVSVGAEFELSEGVADRLSVLVQGDVEVALLTLRVEGGARSYTYGLVEPPSGLTISLSGDEGVLSQVSGEALPAGNNTVVIVVSDNYGGDTEPGTPDIAVTVILSAVLALSDKNLGSRATVIVNESEDDFYSFEALGGYGEYVYSYTTSLGFSVSDSGMLSYDGSGTVGEVVLTVRVDDESSLTPEVELLLSVGISAALSATWSKKVQIFVGQKGRLREVGLSGVGGIPPYTYSLVSGKNISLNAESGDLHITMAFTSVATVSVVWSMEDSDMGRTPAVSGTVVLDISGDLSFKETEPPVVNVTVGEQAGHVIYTAKANTDNTDNLEYKQIGGHSSFTVDVSDAAAGALVTMTAVLSAESTVTLTIEASKGEEQATLILEVRAYDELSASLAAGFEGQIYEGESGELGMIEASGGSGAYVYEWTLPLPVGFVDADGVLEADGQATVGVYTITAIAADDELSSWIAATVEATVSVGAALSLLEIEERLALVQGEVGEELLTVQVSGGDGSYEVIGQDLPSGLTISLLSEGIWAVKRAGDLSVGVNVGTVIIDDSYSTTDPGTPALTAVLTIVGIANFVIASPQTLTATMGVSGVLASLSAEGGTEAKTYGLSTVLVGFSLSPAGVLSVAMDVDAGSHTLTVVVSDGTKGVEQTAMATLLVEVLERLRLLSVPSLTVTTSETQDVVHSFVVDGGVGENIYSLENTVTGFKFDGGNLKWLGNAEAGLYTLSVLVKDGSPQPQESRVLVTVLVIENLALDAEVLSPVWSSFDGAVSTLSARGGLGGELTFGLVGDSQVFTLAAGSSTLSLNAGLRGHQGAATLSVTVSVSDGNDSAEGVITVLVSGALQVVLADGLVAPVHAQYEGLVGSVVVLGGYAGDVSLTLSGSGKDKFELSGGSLSVRLDVSEEQTLTVTVVASRGDETAAQEVVVSVYAPLRLSMPRAVTVATHKGDVLTVIEGSGGKSASYSYELISPPLVGVSINADNGELLLSLTVAASHALTVQLSDGADSLPVSQELSVLVIEPLSDIGETVLAVTLIEDVGEAAAYTFAVAGGIAPYSYTFVESQSLSVNAGSGVLSYSAGGAAPGVYVVTVSADDAAAVIAPIELLLTVEVSAALSANVSERVTVGVAVTGVLGDVEFVASGGVGERSFTLLDDLGHFAIDSDGGDFRITAAFAGATVVSVVWQLDDTDARTPAIEGTLAVAVMSGVSFNPSEKRVYVTVGIEGGVILEAVAFGGEGAYTYSQLGSHVAFTVLSEVGVGSAVSVSMLSDLAEVGEITLTIEVRDGSTPQLLATLLVIVESFEVLSAGLPSDFVGQTYTGETGVLGTVEVSGGSGDYVYSWTLPLPVGFADAGGILSVDDEAALGAHTVTVVVSDKTLAEKGWAAATVEVTVSVGASLSLLEIEDRLALVQGEEGEELLTVQVSGGDGAYKLIGQDLPSGLTISVLADSSQWVVKRAGDLSVGANVGTVIIDDSYSAPTNPGTPALTAVLTIVGVDDLVIASPQTLTATMGVSGVLAELSAEGGTDAKVYKLSPELSGFSLLPAGVLSVSVDVDADSYTLTVVVSDETARVEQTATATLLVEVLERLQLLSVPSLTVTTSETQDVVYSFVVEGGVGEKIYLLENTVTGFGFDIDGGNLRWLGDAEAGLYTLSVLVKDGSPQPQESRASVTVLVIEDLVLDAEVLSPVWSSFDGAVLTLSVSGGRGGELAFGLVGDSQVFTLAADSSTLLLNAGLRGHQGAATLSATVSVSDGYDSAEEVITVLVSGALQMSVSLEDGLIVPVHAQYEGLVGSVLVLGGYAGDVLLTLSGSDKDKFELSGGSLNLQVDVSGEQTLTVTVEASRGDETAAEEVVVSVYAPLGLSMPRAVTVTTHKGDVLAIIEGSGGDASSYSYELISPPLVGVSINAVNGELLLSLTAAASHTLTVQLSDGADSLPKSQEFSVLVIDPFRDIGEMVSAVTLIENVGDVAVHTFAVAGGIAPYSYTFAELQGLSVNAGSGVLSYRAGGGAPGVYVVIVSADDMAAASAPIELLLTVEVSAALGANVAERVNAAVSVTGVLPRAEFISSGGVGERVFALVDDAGHFAIDSDGSNFRITQAFTTVTLVSVVWRLDDTDEKRTPAITGTIVVELFSGMHFPVNEERLLVTVGVQGGVILTAVVAGGDGNYSYSLIGTHAAFTVLSAEGTDSAMTLSMVGVLSEARETTLTIVATDSSGQTSATMRVIVKSYKVLSARLAAGFDGQTYKGEAGQLGSVAPTGGSGNYSYALSSAVLGFEVADEYLLINDMAAISVYTMAVIVSDVDLGVEGWIAATTQLTVSVGAAFEPLEIEQRSALLRWQAGENLLTIQVVGGELPYAISVQSLALGLTISAVGKTEGWEVVRSGDLSVGDNVGTVIINDSYDFPTTPGTPAFTVALTIVGVENVSLLPSNILSPVQSDFAGAVATLSVADGLGALDYRLAGDSLVFGLSRSVLLMTASSRGNQQAAVLSATVRIAKGVEELLVTVEVTVSTALSLTSPWSLVDVAADFDGILATLSASGGLAGEIVYSVIAEESSAYLITVVGNALSLRAQAAEEITVLLTMQARRGDETANTPATVVIYAPLVYADVPTTLTVTAGVSGDMFLWQAEGGSRVKTYTIVAGNDDDYFTVAGGTLAVNNNARQGIYTVSAQVADANILFTATAVATVRVLGQLSLANPPTVLTALAGAVTILYTFVAEGGADNKTYTIISGHTVNAEVLFGAEGGTLSMYAQSKPGDYILQVQVIDDSPTPQMATATVMVKAQQPDKFILEIVSRTTEVPSRYDGTIAVLQGIGGVGITRYTIVSGAEDGFSVSQEGVVNLSVSADKAVVLTVSVASFRNEPSNTVAVEVNVREPLQALAQGLGDFPDLLIGAFEQKDIARITIAGGEGAVHVELLPNGGVFGLVAYDDNFDLDNSGRSWLLSRLSGMLTKAGLTLTLRIRDEYVSEGLLPPIDEIIVVNGVLLSASFAVDFAHTTYLGEQGVLGQVLASGGAEDAYTLTPPVAGFGVLTNGDITVNATMTGLYTLTVAITNSLVELAATTAATVKVLPGLALSPPLVQATLLAGATGVPVIASLLVDGGQSPYTVTVQGSLLSVGFVWGGAGSAAVPVTLYRPANSDSLTAGIYSAEVIFDDSYDGPTEPGTAPVLAAVTVLVAAAMRFESLPDVIAAFSGYPANRLHTFRALGGVAPTYQIVSGDANDYFSLLPNGELYLTTTADAVGLYTLAVEAADVEPPQKATVMATVSVQMSEQRIFVIGGQRVIKTDVFVPASVAYSNDGSADGWSSVVTLGQLTRHQHAVAVFRNRMYVVGGKNLDDAAVWSSNNGVVWQPVAATFGKRYNHQALSHNEQLLVLGGHNSAGELASDVWSYDGGKWTQKTADGFVGRKDFVALSRGGILYVIGGTGQNDVGQNDVWASADGAEWTRLPMMGDTPAWGEGGLQGVVKDGKMIVYGGTSKQVAESVDGIFWQVTAGVSRSRYGGVALYKKDGEPTASLYHFGGTDYDTMRQTTVAQFLISEDNGKSWDKVGVAADSNSPLRRWKFGGLLVFPPDPVPVIAPPPLTLFAPVTVSVVKTGDMQPVLTLTAYFGAPPHSYLIVDGNSEGYFNLNEKNGLLMMVEAPPVGVYTLMMRVRDNQGSIIKITTAIFVNGLLQLGDIFIAGGRTGSDENKLVRSRDQGKTWEVVNFPKAGHTSEKFFLGSSGYRRLGQMEYFQEKLWVIGGYSKNITDSGDQVWSSSNGVNWVLEDGHLPAPVQGHASAIHGNKIYVVGGKLRHNNANARNPNPGQPYVWIFNGEEWTDIGSNHPPPFALAEAGLVSHRGALYVAGGHRQVGEPLKDVWRSDDGGYQWHLAGTLSVGVQGHTMLSDGKRMYVIRGRNGSNTAFSGVWSSIDGAEWSFEVADSNSTKLPGAAWSNGVVYQGDLLIAGGLGDANAWRSEDGGKNWDKYGNSLLGRSTHMMAVVDFPLITPEVKPPLPYWPQQNLLNSLPRGFAGVVGILQAGGGDGKYTYSLENAEGFTVYANGLLSVTAALAPGTQKSFLARVDSAGESAYVQLDFYVLDESLDVGHMFVVGGEMADNDEGTNDVWRSIDGGLTWAKIAVSPSSAVTLPALDDHTVFWHENKLAVFAEDFYLSADGGVTWETIEDIPRNDNIENAAGVSYDNDMFIIGGGLAHSPGSSSSYSTDVWSYRTNVLRQGQWFRGDAPPQHGQDLETTGCANRKALARDDGIYLVGGRCGTSDYNKSVEIFSLGTGRYTNGVWRSYSGTEWSFLAAAPFLPRIGFALLETNGSMYVIGGLARIGDYLSNEYRTLNDVWRSSDGVHWEEVPIIGNRFTRRHGHGGAVDDKGNLVIFGGRSFDLNGVNVSLAAGPFGDVWKSGDGEIWTRHVTNLPPARFDEGGAFMTFIPGKSVPSPLLSAGEITNEVPYGYQGKVARFFGVGGLPGSPFVYQLAGGSEQGFTIDESSGILSLDTAAGGVSGGVARASVVVIRQDAPSARSKIVVLAVSVSAPLELNYAVTSQGFPTVLAGAFVRNLADFEITGGQNPISRELLGGGDIFALESLDSGVGRRSRLLRLNEELTTGAIILTLRVRDAYVESGLAAAATDIEITIWAVSLTQLSPNFISQTFAGESGTLGRLLAATDEYNTYALNPPVSGFGINAQSGAITLGKLPANTYTLTMEVRNAVVAQESAVIATVIVGDAFTASIQPTSVVMEAGQSVYADFATLSVSGGMMFDGGGYDITIAKVTPPLPAGAEFKIADDGGGRYLLSYESDAEVVNSLEYVVRLLVGDDYDGPTTPGTPPLEVMMTMAVSAPLELNYAVMSQGFPTVLAGAFMRNLAEFEITGGQELITLELLGGGDIFALESLDSVVGRHSRLLRLNQELTIGAITLTLRVRDVDVGNVLIPATADIEITIWAVSLSAQLSPDFLSQTFAGESGMLGRLLATADEDNIYTLNPPVSGFDINAQSGAITLDNLSANTYTLTMEVRNADAAQESAVIATVIVGDALTASIQPTSVVVEAGQSVYADFATLSVSGGKMFDGGGYTITIDNVTPPLPAGAEFTITDDDDGRYLLSYESDAEVNSLEYVVRLLVGDDYNGPTTPGTPPLEVMVTMTVP